MKDINHLFAPNSFECDNNDNNIFMLLEIIDTEGKAFFHFSCYVEFDEIKGDILRSSSCRKYKFG